MEKLKWKYDKDHKEWWVNIGTEDGFHIKKENDYYVLYRKIFRCVGSFGYLKNAKTVAQLLYNG